MRGSRYSGGVHRTQNDTETTVADLIGLAAQDIAMAQMVLTAFEAAG